MRITLLAVGRLGVSPEAKLTQSYVERASAIGRSVGLGPVDVCEIESRRAGAAAESEAILARASGAHLLAWDGSGDMLSSLELARFLSGLRDEGVRRIAMAIGAAEGLDAGVLDKAARRLSFGPHTWPHALARVMAAEQIYRAATILVGSPYHRQ